MSEIKNEVQAWLKIKDHEAGISILSKYMKNKAMVRILSMNPNPAKTDKLLYELLKIAGMKENYAVESAIINAPAPVKHKPSLSPPSLRAERSNPLKGRKTIISPKETSDQGEIKHAKPFNKLPLIVQEAIKQKGRLYMKRDQLHAKITDENQLSNKPEHIKKRKPILEKIEHISKRIDELYEAEKNFKENGVLPSEDLLTWDEEPAQEQKKNIPDHSKLSDLQLKNRHTNLKTYLTKDTNQLKYQTQSAQKEENPMPSGPKREKLERKVLVQKEEIAAIEAELKIRAGKSKGNKGK